MFNIFFSEDWIQTADLWNRKRPLYQLSHTTAILSTLFGWKYIFSANKNPYNEYSVKIYDKNYSYHWIYVRVFVKSMYVCISQADHE